MTILANYKFYSTAKVDDCFQFVNCGTVGAFDVARDIHAGVIPIENRKVIIALGNSAILDGYTNVSTVATAIINALVEHFGCVGLEVYVLGLLPQLLADPDQVALLQRTNKSLFRSVRALIRRKGFPLKFLPAYKWLLKWVKTPHGTFTEVDGIYYIDGSNDLNEHGLAHLHLLLAHECQLRRIKYQWKGMPEVVQQKTRQKVFPPVDTRADGRMSEQAPPGRKARHGVKPRHLLGSSSSQTSSSSKGSEPPMLIPL